MLLAKKPRGFCATGWAPRAPPPEFAQRPWGRHRSRAPRPQAPPARPPRGPWREPVSRQGMRGRVGMDGLEDAYGFAPPFFVAQGGHSTGYKVHVGDLPAAWRNDALRRWSYGVLASRTAELPTDFNTGMGLSDRGKNQLLLTFDDHAAAQRAQHLLHGVVIPQPPPAPPTVSNAAYWVPRNYDPWADDPRWHNVPRPIGE